jgi:hypothetical protein
MFINLFMLCYWWNITVDYRRDSFVTHRAFCDVVLADESGKGGSNVVVGSSAPTTPPLTPSTISVASPPTLSSVHNSGIRYKWLQFISYCANNLFPNFSISEVKKKSYQELFYSSNLDFPELFFLQVNLITHLSLVI